MTVRVIESTYLRAGFLGGVGDTPDTPVDRRREKGREVETSGQNREVER